MKHKCLKFISVLLLVLIYSIYHYKVNYSNNNNVTQRDISLINERNIVLAVVACGDRLYETLNMIKSAIMFSESKIMFVILTEDDLIESFAEKLSQWQEMTLKKFTFKIMPLKFPVGDTKEWRILFKPCASQRLFFPSVLGEIDSLIYVDSDTLFLSPIETLWDHFAHMNSTQMAALVPESEVANIGWYNRFARHPFYGPMGVNSGVMLMNLTKMREFHWVEYVIPIYKKYKLQLTFGDQDIINIIFHFHPDKLYLNPCRYNFRTDHCMYMNNCKNVEKEGIVVLHGSRGVFHSGKQPAFQAVYRAFEEFQLNGDLTRDFYQPLETYVDLTSNTPCGTIKDAYLIHIKNYIDKNDKAIE
nr:glucoside xylosyltransferase 2 [Onthophagus taurus]